MPGMYKGGRQCKFRHGGGPSDGCGSAHANDQRICCCVGPGQSGAEVCTIGGAGSAGAFPACVAAPAWDCASNATLGGLVGVARLLPAAQQPHARLVQLSGDSPH